MRILTVCREGNVRSATLARLLKHRGHETIAAGVDRHAPDTLRMLCDWADKVYVVDKALGEKMPEDTEWELFDIGPDIWDVAMHPDLVEKIEGMLDD